LINFIIFSKIFIFLLYIEYNKQKMDQNHHHIQNDELINETYQVIKQIGCGAFSKVYKVINLKNNKYYALKQLKKEKKYVKYGLIELEILKDIQDEAKENYCCNLKLNFDYQGHICMIFNLYGINLYNYLISRKFKGLSLRKIKYISNQLLVGLDFLKKKGIIHCDLKPENIVFEKNTYDLKIIDFGSSSYQNQKIYTYIQSRYYRAPEVVLGYNNTTAMDMWSFGCIIYELFTGKPLFKAHHCSELIVLITELLGIPDNYILTNSIMTNEHFIKYKSIIPFKKDSYSPINYLCYNKNIRIPNSITIQNKITSNHTKLNHDLKNLIDIINKCIVWDPEIRLIPYDALKHQFFNTSEDKSE